MLAGCGETQGAGGSQLLTSRYRLDIFTRGPTILELASQLSTSSPYHQPRCCVKKSNLALGLMNSVVRIHKTHCELLDLTTV